MKAEGPVPEAEVRAEAHSPEVGEDIQAEVARKAHNSARICGRMDLDEFRRDKDNMEHKRSMRVRR